MICRISTGVVYVEEEASNMWMKMKDKSSSQVIIPQNLKKA